MIAKWLANLSRPRKLEPEPAAGSQSARYVDAQRRERALRDALLAK